ncbi:hypothetical protein MNV49_004767 [Pseudohyphozyma bogoriensis]|nr:hypothetical protein MNV49_004767 [Pseudohyphozyma bogoriensis]
MTSEPQPPTLLHLSALLRDSDVIPHVLPESVADSLKGILTIKYPSDAIACQGEENARSKVQDTPEVYFDASDSGATYTLIMTDPDLFMENDQYGGQVRHWLESGVTFSQSGKASFASASGNTTAHLGPAPGPVTRKHRYVFILAREPSGYSPKKPDDFEVGEKGEDLKGRMKFDAAKYVQDQGLTVEGVAYMLVGPDLESYATNAKLGVESLAKKVVGQ